MKFTLNIGEIFESKHDGKYQILSINTYNDCKNPYNIKIKWLDTGNINTTSYNSIIRNNPTDKVKRSLNMDKIYNSKTGPFKIIRQTDSMNGHQMVEIEFLETKARKITRWTDVYNNGKELSNVRDDFKPLVAGVGYIGNASSYTNEYKLWEGMLVRCYKQDDPSYKRYGAKGVTVCERWHCCHNFVQDLPSLPGYNNWKVYGSQFYELDKDYLQQNVPRNKRIYSPTTCCFLPSLINFRLAMDKSNYLGVKLLQNGLYLSYIKYNNFYREIGIFENVHSAAIAYNNAVKGYGLSNYLLLNLLPDIPPNILIKENKSQKDLYQLV